jgi:hypothetical protein
MSAQLRPAQRLYQPYPQSLLLYVNEDFISTLVRSIRHLVALRVRLPNSTHSGAPTASARRSNGVITRQRPRLPSGPSRKRAGGRLRPLEGVGYLRTRKGRELSSYPPSAPCRREDPASSPPKEQDPHPAAAPNAHREAAQGHPRPRGRRTRRHPGRGRQAARHLAHPLSRSQTHRRHRGQVAGQGANGDPRGGRSRHRGRSSRLPCRGRRDRGGGPKRAAQGEAW